MDIQATITARIPSELLPTSPVVEEYIIKWKLFLAPLMDPEIPEDIALVDSSWGILQSELIISLVIFEILDTAIKAFMLTSMSSSSTSSETGTMGIVKKVVTGPTEAEFFSPKETMADVVKPGGLYSTSRDSVCMLASRLKVPLYICPDDSSLILPPKVYQRIPHYKK